MDGCAAVQLPLRLRAGACESHECVCYPVAPSPGLWARGVRVAKRREACEMDGCVCSLAAAPEILGVGRAVSIDV
jgi:hypothetical protein